MIQRRVFAGFYKRKRYIGISSREEYRAMCKDLLKSQTSALCDRSGHRAFSFAAAKIWRTKGKPVEGRNDALRQALPVLRAVVM